MVTLRIIFTILSALCLAVLLPVGTFGGMPYFLACAGASILFFFLVLLCKKLESKKNPQEPTPDFLNPTTKDGNEDNP